MKLKNLNGRDCNQSLSKYLIDWDGKSGSKIQFATKQFLKIYWKSHIVVEEFRIPGSLLRCDFINFTKRIAVEVDGSQHDEFNPFFHNNSRFNYLKSMRRDHKKYEWYDMMNLRTIQIKEKEVKELSRQFLIDKFQIDIV